MQTVKCLLIYPNPESALNEEAGMLLLEQYEDYFSRAKMMTEIHARPSQKSDHHCASSSGSDSSSSRSVTAGVKRPAANAAGIDRKKKDKKKALKRL